LHSPDTDQMLENDASSSGIENGALCIESGNFSHSILPLISDPVTGKVIPQPLFKGFISAKRVFNFKNPSDEMKPVRIF
jgi:hypothetical protein